MRLFHADVARNRALAWHITRISEHSSHMTGLLPIIMLPRHARSVGMEAGLFGWSLAPFADYFNRLPSWITRSRNLGID